MLARGLLRGFMPVFAQGFAQVFVRAREGMPRPPQRRVCAKMMEKEIASPFQRL
jgi:hypothetical protein